MKTKLFLLLILFVIPFGCKEERKIEIVPNPEQEYLSEDEVNKTALLILRNPNFKNNKDEELVEAVNNRNEKLIEAIKSIHNSQIKDTLRYIIKLRLYINENGDVDKVKDVSNNYDRSEYSRDGIKNYDLRDKMNKALIEKIKELKFEPALKDGKKVKSWTDLKGINILAIPDGSFLIDKKPDYKSKLIDINEKLNLLKQRAEDSYGKAFGRYLDANDGYLFAAEIMPSPIGGLKTLQRMIRYPEIAKRAGIEGRVMVLAFIDESGNVVDAQIVHGIGAGCDEAAIDAVKSVKFLPGKKDGIPVKVKVTIPIMFKLQ